MTAFRLAEYDRSISICPRHPEMLWEVAKRSAANWHHGSSTPTDGLPEPPSLPATVLSRSDCDWTGVSLSSLWVMAKSGAARYFESVKIGSPPFNRSLPLGRSWRTAAHAYAHHNHKEKVFGEWVFDCQGSIPFSPHKGKQGKSFFVLSPCSPWEYSIFPSTQKTFLIFLWAYPFFCKQLFQ